MNTYMHKTYNIGFKAGRKTGEQASYKPGWRVGDCLLAYDEGFDDGVEAYEPDACGDE